ncbi:MAG: hypothetical protein AB8B80_14425 [Marinicellaceae bacterium]
MFKFLLLISFTLIPIVAFAAEKPSMTILWVELILLVVLLIVLKIAKFSNQQKFIAFIAYILSGIMTKTIWVPVLIFVGLFYYFYKNIDDDSWN